MVDEARLASRIHHPNVVPTLDVVVAGGGILLVMEYVRGESLARLLRAERERGRLVPLPIVSAIVIGALHGLHAAHEATDDRGVPLGIVHRDVSPQNILVGADGTARVIDFGVAKATGRLQTTTEGMIKGKVAYMAPEQIAVGRLTRAADVYSMGVLLWETLAGRRMFLGESDAQLVVQVLMGVKDPPSRHTPNLPPGLDRLVMKALALDPAARFASAREMADELLRIVPPAFPTAVGNWVEDVAGEALAQRAREVAAIESGSDTATCRASASVSTRAAQSGREPAHAVAVRGEATVPSQLSSLSLESPRSGPAGSTGSRYGTLAGAVGGVLLLAAGVGTVLRGDASPSGRTSTVSAAAPMETASQGAPSSPPGSPPPTASEEPATVRPPQPVPSTASTTAPLAATPSGAPVARPAPSRRPRPKRAPAPKPASPFRFAQPD
jgi:serine/threonine-protein kinase